MNRWTGPQSSGLPGKFRIPTEEIRPCFYVGRTCIGFETGLYRKHTFTGKYLRWESFSPLKRKISLISTLVHRALMICTKRRLNGEIERIKKILLDNGYPKNVINVQIAKTIA